MLIDSDVLIAHLRGLPAAAGYLEECRQTHGPLRTSVVSMAEVTGGMRSAERSATWRLFDSLELEPVTEQVARAAGRFQRRYRASHSSIGIADYLIAATATELAIALATLNTEHFPMFPNLEPAFG